MRSELLAMCLAHISKQTIANEVEAIVVSDVQDEGTKKVCDDWKEKISLKFLEVPRCQQGAARNRGIEHASAPTCLIIGDDIFLQHDACQRHLECHGEHGRTMTPLDRSQNDMVAVLGFTTWDPDMEITPVMKWLEESGWQFAYPMIKRYSHNFIPKEIQHRLTYTSHISLPTEIAKANPFREDVSLYGWEDIEWGLRLQNAGVRLLYEPDAKAFHHHRMTFEQSLKRMETLGKSVVSLSKTVPELDRLPRGFKRIAYEVAALLPTMAGKHRKAFLRGIK